jgi:hypothetical protein
MINLSNHIGAQYEDGRIELKLKRKGFIEVGKLIYTCKVEVVRSKDQGIYNSIIKQRLANEAPLVSQKSTGNIIFDQGKQENYRTRSQ